MDHWPGEGGRFAVHETTHVSATSAGSRSCRCRVSRGARAPHEMALYNVMLYRDSAKKWRSGRIERYSRGGRRGEKNVRGVINNESCLDHAKSSLLPSGSLIADKLRQITAAPRAILRHSTTSPPLSLFDPLQVVINLEIPRRRTTSNVSRCRSDIFICIYIMRIQTVEIFMFIFFRNIWDHSKWINEWLTYYRGPYQHRLRYKYLYKYNTITFTITSRQSVSHVKILISFRKKQFRFYSKNRRIK